MTSTTAPAPRAAAEQNADSALPLLGLLVVLSGVFLALVDFFVVNVALPAMSTDLGASPAALELVVAGYATSYALLLVLGGRLGDVLGRRRLFIVGLVLFTVTSAACGLAPTTATLIVGRLLQGASAAIMVPQVLATITATTTGAGRARALGTFSAVAGVAAVVGQLAGGVLVDADLFGSSWRPIFLVNVPIGLVVLSLVRRYVPETRSGGPLHLDVRGTVLLGLTVCALLLPLAEGRPLGWPAWTIACLVLVPVLATAFVLTELRLERRGGLPLVPPSMLRVLSLRRGLYTGIPFFAGFGGMMLVLALALQVGAGFTPTEGGLATTPMALGFFVVSLAVPRLVARHGRRVIVVGILGQALGLTLLAAEVLVRYPDVTPLSLAVPTLIIGAGQGAVIGPLFRVVLSEVPPARAGVGSGILSTTQQISLALGATGMGTLYLWLGDSNRLDPAPALATVLGVQIVAALVVAVSASRLPRR